MKKYFYSLASGIFLFLIATNISFATQREVPGSYATIQAAIDAASPGDVINVAANTYNENVVVNKAVTLQGVGATTIIDPTSGIGVTVTVGGVTLQNFKVTGATNHGIYAGNVIGLTITNVEASSNGVSGIALQGITGTSVLTNITANSNTTHGLEIGNGSTGVVVNGGTFNSNGTAGDVNTGGGIAIYADAGQSTNGTEIKGTVTANTNTTAGIYLTCTPSTGHINNTVIGATGTITLNNNGSTDGVYSGGAAVIIYGACDNTQITATSNRTSGVSAGLIVIGTNASGANSPTNTVVKNSSLSGFNATSPAGTMKVKNASTTFISSNDVDATDNNTINGVTTGFAVEDLLKHKVDSLALGLFRGPGTELFITPNSGSINRGVTIANNPYSVTKINVKNGTYAENVVISKALTVDGEGTSGTIIDPASGTGIAVTVGGVTLQDLKVTGAATGITAVAGAGAFNGFTATNVTADQNTGEGFNIVGLGGTVSLTDCIATNNGFGGDGSVGSGVNVVGVKYAVVTNLKATSNKRHGLALGAKNYTSPVPSNNLDSAKIDGGTFTFNGTAGDASTGAGISIFSENGKTVSNIKTQGTITDTNNTTAGVFIYSPNGTPTISKIDIGRAGTIYLFNNYSTNTTTNPGTGGAGLIVYGKADSINIKGNFKQDALKGAGVIVVGTNGSGLNSPTKVHINDSKFVGYNAAHPAITTDDGQGHIYAGANVDGTNNAFDTLTVQATVAALVSANVDYNPWVGKVTTVAVSTPAFSYVIIAPYANVSWANTFSGNVTVLQWTGEINDYFNSQSIPPISSSLGTVADEILQISADVLFEGTATLKYKISNRNNFTNTTRVQHYHNYVWTDLGKISSWDYVAPGGSGNVATISLVPNDATEIYAVFQTGSFSVFAFATPSTSSSSDYLTASAGTGQSATVNTAYSTSLSVTVKDVNDAAVSGATVWFRRPSSGASVTFTSGTPVADSVSATTNGSGVATVSISANGTAGAFSVTATTANAASATAFSLTNNAAANLLVKVKVLLQGPYSTGTSLMATSLKDGDYVPLTQPYTGAPWNYAGSEAVADLASIPANSVDWVLVELRTGDPLSPPMTMVAQKAGFVKDDGTVVGTDGSSTLSFASVSSGNYYIVVYHRNHLSVMSANTEALPNASAFDLTASANVHSTTPIHDFGNGSVAMIAGDANSSGTITAVDQNAATVGWRAQNGTVGYLSADFNLSGSVTAVDRNNYWRVKNGTTTSLPPTQ